MYWCSLSLNFTSYKRICICGKRMAILWLHFPIVWQISSLVRATAHCTNFRSPSLFLSLIVSKSLDVPARRPYSVSGVKSTQKCFRWLQSRNSIFKDRFMVENELRYFSSASFQCCLIGMAKLGFWGTVIS